MRTARPRPPQDGLAEVVSRPFRPLTRVVLVLLLLGTATTALQVAGFGPAQDRVWRSVGLLHEAEQGMVDQETGVRGFLLSPPPQDVTFLEPYVAGVRAEAQARRALDALDADAGLRQALVVRSRAADVWQREWAAAAVGGHADRTSPAFLLRGRELFDAYRAADAAAARVLDRRADHVRTVQRAVALAGEAAGLSAVLAALAAVRRTRARLLRAVSDPLARLADVVRAGPGSAAPLGGPTARAEVRELRVLGDAVTELFGALREHDEAVRVHTEEIEAIGAASRALLTDDDPRSAICRAAAGLTGARHVALFEPDGTGRLVTTGAVGTEPGAISFPVDGASLTAQVYRERRSVLVDDTPADPRISSGLAASLGVVSSAFLPVLSDRGPRCLGVLVVALPRPVAQTSQTLLGALEVLAVEAAVAVDRVDLLARLDVQARTDALTGLANRRTWDEELPLELARAGRTGRPVAVALLDLDHFKTYNDAFGHPAGDALLRTAAQRWRAGLRGTDLLARYGGEEFAVVLPDCDLGGAVQLLDALRRQVPGRETCSVGVTAWDGSETAEQVVARADAALYRAKHDGRDRVHADPAPEVVLALPVLARPA